MNISGIVQENINSYVTMDEAISYFATRLYSDEFILSSIDKRAMSLIMATRLMESEVIWNGQKTQSSQILEFPRQNVVDKYGMLIDSETIPFRIKQIQMEIAILLLKEDITANSSTYGISEMKVGQIELSIDSSIKKNVFSDYVEELISDFGLVSKRDKSRGISQIRLERT